MCTFRFKIVFVEIPKFFDVFQPLNFVFFVHFLESLLIKIAHSLLLSFISAMTVSSRFVLVEISAENIIKLHRYKYDKFRRVLK
jgi:hypothetical protein